MALSENNNLREQPDSQAVSALPEKKLIDQDDDPYTFNDVVSKACENLRSRQINHTIRRIIDMEKRICDLERELDEFLGDKG